MKTQDECDSYCYRLMNNTDSPLIAEVSDDNRSYLIVDPEAKE